MWRTPRMSDERGIALAVAVFALVIIGALVAGTFFAGRLEQRTGENTMTAAQVFNAAEGGANAMFSPWNTAYNGIAQLTPTSAGTVSLGGGLSRTSTVMRLNNELFLVRTDAQMTQGGQVTASRSVGMLGRLRTIQIPAPAALTVLGNLRMRGTADVNGNDLNPAGWGGCPSTVNSPGVIYNNGTVQVSGGAQIQGQPPAQLDPTLDSTRFTTFGDLNFNQLAASANIVFPGGSNLTGIGPTLNASNQCDRTNNYNWGEPLNQLSPCANYFPVIYIAGSGSIRNDRGQGILLVNGDLVFNGNFQFYGLVIVQGSMDTGNGGAVIHGSAMARNADLDLNSLSGTALVQFSTCAIQRAINAAATVTPMSQRSWVQMY